jgi:hypothetical protein
MEEENKIQEGEIVSDENLNEFRRKKKKRKDLYVELVLFFILGVLIGITLKTEAVKRITIGYNDYQMDIKKQDYNINDIQTGLIKKSAEESAKNQNSAAEDNGSQNAEGTGEAQNQTENESPAPVPN